MARFKLKKTKDVGIFRREDTGQFYVRTKRTDPKTGRPKDVNQTLPEGATVDDARAALLALASQTSEASQTEKPLRFAAFSVRWLERKKVSGDWTEGSNTALTNGDVIKLHLIPAFGPMFVDKINRTDVQNWIHSQNESDASPTSVKQRLDIMKAIAKAFVQEYNLPINPTDGVKAPRRKKSRGGKNMVLTPDQVAQLVTRSKRTRWYPIVILGFGSGARPSELLAVQTPDLDLSDKVGVWSIERHVIVRTGETIPGTKGHEDGREVYLDPITTDLLKEAIADREISGWLVDGGSRSKTGAPSYTNLNNWLRRTTRDLFGEGLSCKVFRQTYISNARRYNPTMSKANAGHADDRTHGIYDRSDTVDSMRREAAEGMATVIPLRAYRDEKVGTQVGTTENNAANG